MKTNYKLFFLALIACCSTSIFGQGCFIFEGDSPAFEVSIPEGVTVTSVDLEVTDYSSGGDAFFRSRGRSFSELETLFFSSDGIYPILLNPISGPSIQNYQIESGLDSFCGAPNDNVRFNWRIIIRAIGEQGNAINFSGSLGDNLANPDNVGAVYQGDNIVTGSIDLSFDGEGFVLYPDMDFDGFGDANADPRLFCNDFCDPSYVDNNDDCNDLDPQINPNAVEIPNNGIDEDCDGVDLIICDPDILKESLNVYPNPVSDFLNIEYDNSLSINVKLFKLRGYLVFEGNDINSIDVRSFRKGFYILRVKDECTQDVIAKWIYIK